MKMKIISKLVLQMDFELNWFYFKNIIWSIIKHIHMRLAQTFT